MAKYKFIQTFNYGYLIEKEANVKLIKKVKRMESLKENIYRWQEYTLDQIHWFLDNKFLIKDV